MKIHYTDEHGDAQPLVRNEWPWPDRDDFSNLRGAAAICADAVSVFYKKRGEVNVSVTPSEEAEAKRKGASGLEKLIAGRRALADASLAHEALKKLAWIEGGEGLGSSLHAIESSFPARVRAFAQVGAWNAVNVVTDRWLIEAMEKRTGADRTKFMLELKDGAHAATARALVRTVGSMPELVPGFDPSNLPAITEAVARREAPAEMAELDEVRHAAAVARAAWRESVRIVRDAVSVPDSEFRKLMGDEAIERLNRPVPASDPHWVEGLTPVRRTTA
ncbi:MAG: hypothetical protein AB7U95_37830 [Reyranella sp.]